MNGKEITENVAALKATVENVDAELARLQKEKVEKEESLAITRNAITALKAAATLARTELATIRKALRS